MKMKKIISTSLAASMLLSTSVMSFATDVQPRVDLSETIYVMNDIEGYLEVYDPSTHDLSHGDSFYILIVDESGIKTPGEIDSDDIDRMNVYADWEIGEDYVVDEDIVMKKALTISSASAESSYTVIVVYDNITYTLTGVSESVINDELQLHEYISSYIESRLTAKATLTDEELLSANSLLSQAESGYIYNNTYYSSKSDVLTAVGYGEILSGSSIYKAVNPDNVSMPYGTTKSDAADRSTDLSNATGYLTSPTGTTVYTTMDDAVVNLAGYTPVTSTIYIDSSNNILSTKEVTTGAVINTTDNVIVDLANDNELKLVTASDSFFYDTADLSLPVTTTNDTGLLTAVPEGSYLTSTDGVNWIYSASLPAGYTTVTSDYVMVSDSTNVIPVSSGISGSVEGDFSIDNIYYANSAAAYGLVTTISSGYMDASGNYYPTADDIPSTYIQTIPGPLYIKSDLSTYTTSLPTGITEINSANPQWLENGAYISDSDLEAERAAALVSYNTDYLSVESDEYNSPSITEESQPTYYSSVVTTDYYYFVEVETEEYTGTDIHDIVGDVGIGTSSSNADDYTVEAIVTLTQGEYDDGAYQDGDIDIVAGEAAIVYFDDYAEDIAIFFGDDAMFYVDVSGQDELNLAYNTDWDSEIASKYGYANLDFINFEDEPRFNRNGDMYIYTDYDEDVYIYEINGTAVEEIYDLEYDYDEDAWTFRTNQLGRYVISDEPLPVGEDIVPELEEGDEPTVEEPEYEYDGKPNPDTGR